jgi:hypothetical protein
MSPRRHSADLRGRRHDLGIGVRDMAVGLGIELARLLSMEDGTGWSAGERHIEMHVRVLAVGSDRSPSFVPACPNGGSCFPPKVFRSPNDLRIFAEGAGQTQSKESIVGSAKQ